MKFPPMGFLGTFSMSFYIIFWTYSEKKIIQLVGNLLNVKPNGHLLYGICYIKLKSERER